MADIKRTFILQVGDKVEFTHRDATWEGNIAGFTLARVIVYKVAPGPAGYRGIPAENIYKINGDLIGATDRVMY